MVNAKLGMASNFVRILHTWNPLSIILDPPLSTPTGMSLNTQVIDRYWACDSGGHIRRHDPIFWTKISTTDFSALQDALQWDMEKTCVDWVAHYIDDFITIGASGSNACAANSLQMQDVCEQIGLPKHDTTLPFLGIELDSVALEIRLPPEKLIRLHTELAGSVGRLTRNLKRDNSFL